MLELWKTWTLFERLLIQEEQPRWLKGKTQNRKNADAHNLDSKPSIAESEVEIDEFSHDLHSMSTHFKSLRRCEDLNGSRLELTQVQERRHGLRVSRTERRFLVTVISLSAQQQENLSKVASECKLWVATIGDPISGFEVFKHRCANHCCLLENTRLRAESLCCMVTKVTCSTKCSNVAKNIDSSVQKELRYSQYRGCTVAYKENNVYNIYVKPRENKIDAMELSGDSESGGCSAGSEPVRARDPEVPGGAHDPNAR